MLIANLVLCLKIVYMNLFSVHPYKWNKSRCYGFPSISTVYTESSFNSKILFAQSWVEQTTLSITIVFKSQQCSVEKINWELMSVEATHTNSLSCLGKCALQQRCKLTLKKQIMKSEQERKGVKIKFFPDPTTNWGKLKLRPIVFDWSLIPGENWLHKKNTFL